MEKTTPSNDIIGHVNEIDFKFQLDINKMKIGQKYIFDYHNTKYMAIKNEQSDLKLSEICIENK